ncbi:ABC transporter ATP-binding protein [Actinoplanes regularis]|uniref:ABC-2 type transport system ATP-binding protein n=1 Tax=Actinoplanes regularis TaxID=52697 RepID=A0A238YA76_9ACTN|nr:ABC transporter ATP-binding protein [Actinoplanes regularis]GIE86073.1 ABC transporter ATP-binding protein [Actinoplanes regularis]GLW27772.1 ABC transporter ATP-binding protein [Actinoplanes regularis]SNR67718.1 ABC-2 type transport system ATP-binding protein [Actinoplanes regularis]
MITESTPVLETERLGKRYGHTAALTDCTLRVPAGRIVGLVGPNGAGKSTLLGLTCGVLGPTTGSIEVLGNRPGGDAAQLARVGFVAQDAPVYRGLSVADHLRLGARLNPRWDRSLAERRVGSLGLDPAQKAGRLSGGQRAQLALTIAAAKRAELLILDEPVAALDPLARRAFLRDLLAFVAELGVSVVLSSHLLGDLEQVCDHLIVLAGGRVQLAGDVDDLLAVHHRVSGALPAGAERVHEEVVRCAAAPPGARPVDLEELGLAYMTRAAVASIGGAA